MKEPTLFMLSRLVTLSCLVVLVRPLLHGLDVTFGTVVVEALFPLSGYELIKQPQQQTGHKACQEAEPEQGDVVGAAPCDDDGRDAEQDDKPDGTATLHVLLPLREVLLAVNVVFKLFVAQPELFWLWQGGVVLVLGPDHDEPALQGLLEQWSVNVGAVDVEHFSFVLAELAAAVADDYVVDLGLVSVLLVKALLGVGNELTIEVVAHEVDGAATEATAHDA